MRRISLLLGTLLVSSLSFANPTTASGLDKNSPQLNALGSAWKSKHTTQSLAPEDIEMVYGGADMSHRLSLEPLTAAA